MSDKDINEVNCGGDCGSCGDGNDEVNCSDGDCGCGDDGSGGGGDGSDGGGHSHEQADLKMLIFVLVLILAGAVAAHSLFNKDKNADSCGAGGCPSGSGQVEGCPSMGTADQMPSGGCPVSGKLDAVDDGSAGKCPITGDDISTDPK